MKSCTQRRREPHYFDVVFVLPGYIPGFPSGGRNIVYRLAGEVANRGQRVAIIFMRNGPKFLYRITGDPIFLPTTVDERLKWFFWSPGTSKVAYHILGPAYRALRGIDYDYSVLSNVSVYFCEPSEIPPLSAGRVLATFWMTAYYVRDICRATGAVPYYLVQNSEDDPTFSGRLSTYARSTYGFGFKMIVNNQREYDRFSDSEPSMLRMAVDSSVFQVRVPVEKRRPHSVLFPLRQGVGKGASYMLEAARALRNRDREIEMLAFGNLSRRTVPSYIRFYRSPSITQLVELYNSSQLFISPSVIEGYGSPAIEAMLCGNAVIATSGSSNELFMPGSNVILVPPRDGEAIATAVVDLLHDPSRLRAIQASASAVKSRVCGYREMAEAFMQLVGLVGDNPERVLPNHSINATS